MDGVQITKNAQLDVGPRLSWNDPPIAALNPKSREMRLLFPLYCEVPYFFRRLSKIYNFSEVQKRFDYRFGWEFKNNRKAGGADDK